MRSYRRFQPRTESESRRANGTTLATGEPVPCDRCEGKGHWGCPFSTAKGHIRDVEILTLGAVDVVKRRVWGGVLLRPPGGVAGLPHSAKPEGKRTSMEQPSGGTRAEPGRQGAPRDPGAETEGPRGPPRGVVDEAIGYLLVSYQARLQPRSIGARS